MKKSFLYPIYIVALLSLLYFDKAINYIMTALNYATSPIKCSGIFLFGIGLAIIILIESLRPKTSQKPYRTPQSPYAYPLYDDQPTDKDAYGRDTTARLLIDKIFSTFNTKKPSRGSLVININETYGYGKTTFLNLIEHELQCIHEGEYYLIHFRPWLCDSEKAIIRELFTLLSNALGMTDIKDNIQEYLYMLLLQSEQIAPSEIRPFYALFPRKNKNKTLQELHDKIKDRLQEITHPIIITIDDIDRLHEKELVAILKLIRDTADFPNIYYIVAADNTYLETMLIRQGVEHPHRFLQKFFNLDYLLPAHEEVPTQILKSEMDKILNTYGYNQKDISSTLMMLTHLDYLNVIFSNMRDVYRFLNVYTSVLDILRANNNLHFIVPYDLFCLTIIRHLTPNIYKILRDCNDQFLEINRKGMDAYYKVKKDINLVNINRNVIIEQHLAEALYRNDPQKHEKPQKPRPCSEGLTLETAIQKTTITYDQIIFYLLDHLFESPSNSFIDERSICRCNTYFLYFSGKMESNKLTTAQTIDILQMNIDDYETRLEQLFKEGKNKAFISNFDYAYVKSGISKEKAMKMAYIYLKKKFYYTEDIHHEIFETFENYINSAEQSFLYFLYGLYGKNHNGDIEKYIKDVEKQLEAYCKTEKDLNMLILAFYLFSERLSDFCFGREYIEKMIWILSNRLINEHMEGKSINTIDEPTFDSIYLLKNEFSTKGKWAKKFKEFMSKDQLRCMQWLCSVIKFYSNGTFEWHDRHRKAVLGEGFNSGDELLNYLKQKFPDCSEAIEELNQLQKYNSLSDIKLKDDKFIQMAGEVNAAFIQKPVH